MTRLSALFGKFFIEKNEKNSEAECVVAKKFATKTSEYTSSQDDIIFILGQGSVAKASCGHDAQYELYFSAYDRKVQMPGPIAA